MKSKFKILTILLGIIISTVMFSKQASAQQSNVSFQVFYDELSPYGQWVDHPNYGYIWIPDADEDFAPYSSDGYWVLSDYGWTWVSDYEWGWAPFHYGRWDRDRNYGWFWIPDNQWGPAWVTWRRANGYYGWSPMRPGISISLSFGRRYDRDRDYWMFVRDRDLQRHDISRYYVNRNNHDRIIRSSTIINRTYSDGNRRSTYIYGPDRADVQRITGKRVNTVSIRDNNRPGHNMNNGELRIYRPQMRNSNDRDRRPAPKEVTRPENVRQPYVRNESYRPGSENRQSTQPQRQNDSRYQRQSNDPQRQNDERYQRQNTDPQRQNDERYQRQATPPQQQTTQPKRQTTDPQRQNYNNQYQRQTTQPQRQAIPPEQIQRQQRQEELIQKRDRIQKEEKQREEQKVTPPATTNRETETTHTQRSKAERDKRAEERKEREERK